MSFFSLLGLTPCSQGDANPPLYCISGAREDCCDSGIGRISMPLWDISKRQEYASVSGSFDQGRGHYSTLRTTSTTTGSTIRVTRTISVATTSQAQSPPDAPSLPFSSHTIMTSPTGGPKTLATNTSAIDAQAPPPSSGLSTGTKAGIGAGVAVCVLLILGLAAAASIFYRRSKQLGTRDNNDDNTGDSGLEDFANNRLIPEMDATHSERPAELEDIVLSEVLGNFVAKAFPRSHIVDGVTKGNIYEMEA